jgi:osmotically-inducible protein OsmY
MSTMSMTQRAHRTDVAIQADVLAELDWDTRVRPNEIGVSVKDGVVTLSGTVDSSAKRWAAQAAAFRVLGVTAVANDLGVHLPSSAERTDGELAQAAVTALTWDADVPAAALKVSVAQGWVTVNGEVDTAFQRQQAVRALHRLAGVKGVIDQLVVRAPRPAPADVQQRIERALLRNAETDAHRIRVEVEGQKVILKGTVRSYAERLAAEGSALSAPGIAEVENQLGVSPVM